MPAAEITAAITSIRATIDLTKAIVGVRDHKMIESAVTEINSHLADAIGKLVESKQTQLALLDEIATLKAELNKLTDLKAEQQRYELKPIGNGASAYMLKPEVRGPEHPHWLCPTCFKNGKISHLQFSVRASIGNVYRCKGCDGHVTTNEEPRWL
jgi:hypothetical protein